jgi:hypothetical protein
MMARHLRYIVIALACYIAATVSLAKSYPHVRHVKTESSDGETHIGSIGWLGLPLPFLGIISQNEQPYTGLESPDQKFSRHVANVEFNPLFFAIDATLLLSVAFHRKIWRYISGQYAMDRFDASE